MKIKCWGARGSVPVSGKEFEKFGGDTTCLEIRTQDDDIIIVDTGTGARSLGNQLVKEKKRRLNILFTHTHWDHVQGFPFFKPIYFPETSIRIFGCPFSRENVKEMIAPLLVHPYFPINFDDIKAAVEYIAIGEDSFTIGPMTITPIFLSHPNKGLGFKFSENGVSFVFMTDNELTFAHPGGLGLEDYIAFCTGSDLLMHDAEYTEEDYKTSKGWGHSVYKDALQLAIKAEVKQFGLFHHNQNRVDDDLDGIVEDCRKMLKEQKQDIGCFAARQGMEIFLSKDQPFVISDEDAHEKEAESGEVLALRKKHQKLQIEQEESVQKTAARANDEISQLKSTINALRNKLEEKQIENEGGIQQAKSLLSNEIIQLKDTISALHDTMTGNMINYEKKLQETKQSLQSESTELKQTISAIRDEWEARNVK